MAWIIEDNRKKYKVRCPNCGSIVGFTSVDEMAGESYGSCLDPGPMKQELIEIKMGKYSLAEARAMADKTKAHVEEMAEYAYSIYPNKEDPEVNALLDDVQYEIMKTAVEKELSEDD